MTIAAGTRLGSFEILGLLGAGGMGEVYRARDTRVERAVALKVLPEEFFEGEERAERFAREARLLASLNHPGIATLYSFEEIPGSSSLSSSSSATRHVLVMELVEGDGLDVRIARGPLPLEESLSIARQMAEALEAAHEKGIVHRDLKPANVRTTPDGRVKLLDFGLAKAFESDGGASPDLSLSPTLTARATAAGVILGTAAYMSPEQARGKSVDKRADVWAFGVVLFEMLTGKRLFQGETVSDTLAAVLREPVDFGQLPPATPPSVRVLLERCLERDPKQRLQAIGESRIALERTIAGASGAVRAAGDGVSARLAPATPERRALPWAVAAVLGAAAALAFWAPWRTAPRAAPVRVSVELGADTSLVPEVGPGAVLSPDGTLLAFVGQKETTGAGQLWLRRLEQLQASPLAGTEGARGPFFSPDGQWIGYTADGKLKKVSVTGGASVVLCEVPNLRGAWWAEDGTIVFEPNTGVGVSLLRVPAAGGKPEPLTKLEEGETTQRWPQVLPGGKAVLYTGHSTTSAGFEDANIVVQPLPKGPRKILQRGGYHGRYLPSGHVVYVHDSTLFAAPFDLGRLEVTGPPVPVVEGISSTPPTAGSNFSISNGGALVYLPGRSAGRAAPIHWMDLEGRTSLLRATPSSWANVRFSPDGQKLAMDVTDSNQSDVWVYEWARDTMTRLTFDPGEDTHPVWTPDGRRIAFASSRADRNAPANVYWQRADGTGDVQRLTESANRQIPSSFHPSGRFLACMDQNPKTGWDIVIVPIEGDEASGFKGGKPSVFLNAPYAEVWPEFSPDGRWLAYFSNESGRFEVYVRPFPGPGGKWQISAEGGVIPAWSRTGRELYFGTLDGRFMAASWSAEGDSFRAEKPRAVGQGRYVPIVGYGTYALHPDGKRFAILKPADAQSEGRHDKVVFVFNFFDELKRVAGAARR